MLRLLWCRLVGSNPLERPTAATHLTPALSAVPDIRCGCEIEGNSDSHNADEADLRCGNPNGSYRKPQVTWENPP